MQLVVLGIAFFCLLATVGAVGIGEACAPANGTQGNCTGPNVVCTKSAKCNCTDGYKQSNSACARIVGFGDPCGPSDGNHGNCTEPNLMCAQSGKCECEQGYTQSGKACAAKNEGSAQGHLSIWMLCTTFLTMSLAVHVV